MGRIITAYAAQPSSDITRHRCRWRCTWCMCRSKIYPFKKISVGNAYGRCYGWRRDHDDFCAQQRSCLPSAYFNRRSVWIFVVPMNALLQHRGHVLMSAGHSIAVQNFNENLSVLTMLTVYAIMVSLNLNVNIVIIIFGVFVASIMYLIMRRHAANQREHDSLALIGEHKH